MLLGTFSNNYQSIFYCDNAAIVHFFVKSQSNTVINTNIHKVFTPTSTGEREFVICNLYFLMAALPVPIPPSGTADLMPRGGGVPLGVW